ncbi:MAG: hypothetical protein RSE62_03545 [Citrobacter sp.]
MPTPIQNEAANCLTLLMERKAEGTGHPMDYRIADLLQRVALSPVDTQMAECDTSVNEGIRKIVKILGGVEHRIFTETGALRLSLGLVLCTIANKVEEWKQDKLRMDYLERNLVEVREHLRYGSRIVFNAYSKHDLEEPEVEPSDLRAQTDVQIAKGKK